MSKVMVCDQPKTAEVHKGDQTNSKSMINFARDLFNMF